MRKWNLMRLVLPALVVAAVGCGEVPRETPEDPSPIGEAGATEAERTVASVITDKALVQVLIYGLAVFDFDRDRSGDLKQVSVHFPKVTLHDMQIGQGVLKSGSFEWKILDPNFSNKTLRLNLAGDLGEVAGLGTLGSQGFPKDKVEARDVRWMLDNQEVGGNVVFDPSKASGRLLLTSGTLETCALVHDSTGEEVCRVRNEQGSERFKRGVSEYMVLRHVVERGSSVEVLRDLGQDLTIQEIDLVECRQNNLDECVKWKNDYYRYIHDVVIRNVPSNPSEKRTMKSVHGKSLRDLFPVNDYADWEVISTDCDFDSATMEWVCPRCKKMIQPTCWSHFMRYFPQATGLNASVCPFVGYP